MSVRTMAVLLAILLGAFGALFYVGYVLGSARAEARVTALYETGMRQAADQYLADARARDEAAAQRLAQLERRRQYTEQAARQIEAALAALPLDAGCDWSGDELRELKALYRARFGAGDAGRVPGEMR